MTLLHEIREDKIEVINLAAHDLDDDAEEIAHAIKKNQNANQLHLELCDFNDSTFKKIVDAICERENGFIFVDVSTNQFLTQKCYDYLTKLINSKKVEELSIGNMNNVIVDRESMKKLVNLASINKVILYVDDKTRATLQISCDNSLMQNSLFKPRDFRDISNVLANIFSDPNIFSLLLPKLSKFMLFSLNEAIMKATSSEEMKDEAKNQDVNPVQFHHFKSLENTKLIISELPLFIRYKIMDVCIINRLHKLLKTDFKPLSPRMKL